MAFKNEGGTGSKLPNANTRENRVSGPFLSAPNVRESRTPSTTQYRSSTYFTGNPNLQVPAAAKPVSQNNSNNDGKTKILGNDLPQDTGGNNNDQTTSSMPKQEKPPKDLTAKDLGVVKTPGRDVTNLSSLVSQESADTITRLLFEQFSAVELAQILTSNTIGGIDQQYSIISNLSDIRRRYNTTKQLTIMDKLSPMDGVFAIDINSKIPGDEYIERNNLNSTYQYIDENGDLRTVQKGSIYIDTNGDLIIEFDNMLDDEFIQVQIDQNGTIYKVIKE